MARDKHRTALFLITIFCATAIDSAFAYIGPGAGFAVISSFFILSLTGVVAIIAILFWPFRAIMLYYKRRKLSKKRKVGRVVVVGLDGLDPYLTNQFMKRGFLPKLKALKENGSFKALRTTTPSISPAAWSTFSTGVNPGKHRIFDFFTRDPNTYLPILSSVQIRNYTKAFGIGRLKFHLPQTSIKLLRKSTSFWKILGRHGVFCSILRVPITFPPEKFYGVCLSGMCIPDIRGTQGSFTYFTTDPNDQIISSGNEGNVVHIDLENNRFKSNISGPILEKKGHRQPLTLPFDGKVDYNRNRVSLMIKGEQLNLTKGDYSPWVKLEFKIGRFKRIRGIARFLLTEITPHIKIYLTPINIDPESPSLPVSHPISFSVYLAKQHGRFATLGLAEDTWALNEGIIDEDAFLKQSYDIFKERKRHFMDALVKNPKGLTVGVFDTTDRIQHMFFRYLDLDHPANRNKDAEKHKDTIAELYRKMDDFIGEVINKIEKNDIIMVISDHGFKSFKWGVNLNSWLYKEGYLVLRNGSAPVGDWFSNVDWPRTRAYGYGLTGIFLNMKGRERYGTVLPGENRKKTLLELKSRLESLVDENNKTCPIRRCILAEEVLKGPYTNEAPDLIVGYNIGYRTSWNSAVGKITDQVIESNTKNWSGDHTIDPDLVPGVFFSNWRLNAKMPALEDIAPTILSLFGLGHQRFQDGKVLDLNPPQ